MKRILLLLFFIFFPVNVFSDTDQEKFLRANELYKSEKFKEALDLYESIKNKSSQVLLNLGNSYFKLEKFEQAILNWRRSIKNGLSSNSINIENNIKLAYEKLGVSFNQNNFINFLNTHLFFIQILFLFFWIIFNFYLQSMIRLKCFWLITFFILLNFSLLGAIVLSLKNNEAYGIVLKENLPVLAGPGKFYHQVNCLKLAEEVKVLNQINEWVKISKCNQSYFNEIRNSIICGWVPIECIAII